MAVGDSLNIGATAINLRMNKSLKEYPRFAGGNKIAFKIQFHHIIRIDERGCERTRNQEMMMSFGMTTAHMPERIKDSFASKDSTGLRYFKLRLRYRVHFVSFIRGSYSIANIAQRELIPAISSR